MKTKQTFLGGILLSSVFLLILTLNIEGNHIYKVFSNQNQSAEAIKSAKTQTKYNISYYKEFPGTYNFDYVYEKTSSKSKEVYFDLPIIPFDDELARKELGDPFADFGPIRDAWNYPVKENAFMKKEEPRKQSFLNSLKTNKAIAYDEDTANPGVYNCRANTGVTGYFKAYFEDVALNTNVGFDDPSFGEGRREEACQVLEDMSEMLMMGDTTVTPDILFKRGDQNLNPGALAGASSYFGYYSVGPDNGALHKHIISRQDPTPGQGNFDALIITNWNGINWSVDSSLNPNTYDFYTVMWHEMMHALGFRTLLPAVIPETGVEHRHGTFDYHTHKDDSLQNRFITAITNLLNVPVGAPSPWFITNQVVYRGVKNILNATPDGIRPVYSPTSWQQGSSLSHFDMNRASGETYVMHPSIGLNTEREIHEHELEVLCHLGYMVEGMEGCEVPTPVAVDDNVVLSGTEPVCIDLLENDLSHSGSVYQLRVHTFQLVSSEPGDVIQYFSELNCSGSVQLDSYNSKSFRLIPTADTSSRVFKYINRNVNTDRTSLPGLIRTNPSCESITDENEYVCNGDFGVSAPYFGYPSITDINCSSWGVAGSSLSGGSLNVCNFYISPDVVLYDIIGSNNWSSYTSPSPPETDFPYIRGAINLLNVGRKSEIPIMKLSQPLTLGQQYTLRFDVASNDTSLDLSNIKFALTMGGPLNQSFFVLPSLHQSIFSQSGVVTPGEWYSFEETFIANDTYEFIIFYRENTVAGSNYWDWVLFDNISIRPANTLVTNTLSGTTYQDLNQNGSQQTVTEPGLSGLVVGLFQAGNNTPIQTSITQDIPNLGEYEFSNLADGIYYVALIGEGVYQNITQPSTSSDPFPTYNHMYSVSLSSNQTVEGRDFGVVLQQNTPDIMIKKILIDPTLSFFDRYITWRIIVQNIGINNATNVLIKEIVPPGLIYHSNVTPAPNTYDSSVHILNIPTLSAGGQTYIDITMKVPNSPKVCGVKTNIAVLHHLDQLDTNPSNNQDQASIKLQNCPITEAPQVKTR